MTFDPDEELSNQLCLYSSVYIVIGLYLFILWRYDQHPSTLIFKYLSLMYRLWKEFFAHRKGVYTHPSPQAPPSYFLHSWSSHIPNYHHHDRDDAWIIQLSFSPPDFGQKISCFRILSKTIVSEYCFYCEFWSGLLSPVHASGHGALSFMVKLTHYICHETRLWLSLFQPQRLFDHLSLTWHHRLR